VSNIQVIYQRHILADKQEYSSLVTVVLKQHIPAEKAKIAHNLAKSTKSVNGFDRLVERVFAWNFF
jgi:hypothetical protein